METQSTEPDQRKWLNKDLEELKISKEGDGYLFDSEDDSFPDIECDLCCKEFSSVKMYEQHLSSKKHYQMLTKRKMMQKVGKPGTLNGETSNTGVDIHLEADDSTEDLSCEICSKFFSGYIPYVTHMKSNVHFKNVKKQELKNKMKDLPEVIGKDDLDNESDDDGVLQKPFARCTPCQKVFHDPKAFQQHMKGALHKKKMQEQKTLESLKIQVTDNFETAEDEEFYIKCDTCNKSFSGPIPYKIHLHSAIHQKELKKTKLEEELKQFFTKEPESLKLICTECKKMFTDPFALKVHLESNSHDKQKAKEKMFSFVAAYPEIVVSKSIQNLSSDEENNDGGSYQNGSYFFVCKLCHLSFSGPESVRDHVQSKRHIQAKKEKEDRKCLQRKLKEKQNSNKTNGVMGSGHMNCSTKIDTGSSSNNVATVTSSNAEVSNKLSSKDSEVIDDFEVV